jgi:hypothetical protein
MTKSWIRLKPGSASVRFCTSLHNNAHKVMMMMMMMRIMISGGTFWVRMTRQHQVGRNLFFLPPTG